MSHARKVLCLAPHADDETLGAGGTLARHVREGDHVTVAILTGHGEGKHPLWDQSVWETVRGEAREAMSVLGVQELLFRELPAAMLPDLPVHVINTTVWNVVDEVQPEILYVPFSFDLHNDHRLVAEAASVAWRTSSRTGQGIKQVLMYETQSETHWNAHTIEPGFLPNWYVDVTNTLETKIEALRLYRSQIRDFPDARSIEAVDALARWRGSLQGMRAAEAFVLVRGLV